MSTLPEPPKKNRKPRARARPLALFMALLFIIPSLLLAFSAKTDMYSMTFEDKSEMYNRYLEDILDAGSLNKVEFHDIVGYITGKSGTVSYLEFQITWAEDSQIVSLAGTSIEVTGNTYRRFVIDQEGDSYFQCTVAEDRDGLFNTGRVGPGLTLDLRATGYKMEPNDEVTFRLNPSPYSYTAYLPPIFISSFSRVSNDRFISVRLDGGSYPDHEDVWFINNTTVIANREELVTQDIVVLPGGTLELSSATLILDTYAPDILDVIVCQGGTFKVWHSLITVFDKESAELRPEPSYGYRYYLWVFGDGEIEQGTFYYYQDITFSSGILVHKSRFGHTAPYQGWIKVTGADVRFDECSIEGKITMGYSDVTISWTDIDGDYVDVNSGLLRVDNSTFKGNGYDGIRVTIGDLFVENSTFEGYAEAIDFRDNLGNISISDSRFRDNRESILCRYSESIRLVNNEVEVAGFPLGKHYYGYNGINEVYIVGNIINFTSFHSPFTFYNTELTLQGNIFNSFAYIDHDMVIVKNTVETSFLIYSETRFKYEPTLELRSVGSKKDISRNGGSDDFETDCTVPLAYGKEKDFPWCLNARYNLPLMELEFDGDVVDPNPYQASVSVGTWTGKANFRVSLDKGWNWYHIKITRGSFLTLTVILIPFMVVLGLIGYSVTRNMPSRGDYGGEEEVVGLEDEEHWLIGERVSTPLDLGPQEEEVKEDDLRRW